VETNDEPRVEYIPAARAEPNWLRQQAARLIAGAVVLVLLLVFVLQNGDQVQVRLIAWDVDLRLAWALLIAAAFGAVLGWLLPKLRRSRSQV
jgi:uncharacterized integral membrane protein